MYISPLAHPNHSNTVGTVLPITHVLNSEKDRYWGLSRGTVQHNADGTFGAFICPKYWYAAVNSESGKTIRRFWISKGQGQTEADVPPCTRKIRRRQGQGPGPDHCLADTQRTTSRVLHGHTDKAFEQLRLYKGLQCF